MKRAKKILSAAAAPVLIAGMAAAMLLTGCTAAQTQSSITSQTTTESTSQTTNDSTTPTADKAELNETIRFIMDKIDSLPANDPHKGVFREMFLVDDENVIKVVLGSTDEATLKWFRENICDKPFLRFKASEGYPGND